MSEQNSFQPAKNITETFNTVNPDQSLQPGDPRYVDFFRWRGEEHIVEMITRRITRADQAKPIQYLKQLLAGHRGCGKTTELLLIKQQLEQAGYFVVYFDSALEIDMNNVDYADILLSMMYQVESQVRQSGLKTKIDESRLDALALRLAEETIKKESKTEIENALEAEFRIGPELPFFARVMLAVRGMIKSGASTTREIRLHVRQRTTQFLEDLNDLIDHLQVQLPKKGKKGIVIIIDSLDRMIPNPKDEKERRTTHTDIYIDHADHLKAPHCHTIYTVPISIYFNENLNNVFSDQPLMIPMIKIREQNGQPCRGALVDLRRVIEKRIDVAEIFENKNDVEKLCLASGGHIRDLLHLARYACDYSSEKITSMAVDKAIRALVREYDRLVKDEDLPRLVKVHREKELPSDPEYSLLPYHLVVLEYQNGERWADIHPAVQETRKFRRAWEERQNESKR